MEKTKVFVGNLSFKTNEKDLTKEFELAGKVSSANIISRGSRSLGYGFVIMENEADADKAVELLNKKLIDSREINVERARPQVEKPQTQEDPANKDSAHAAGRGGNRSSRGGGRGRQGGFRRRGPARTSTNADGTQGSPSASSPASGSPSQAHKQQPQQPREPREPRPPRDPRPRAPRPPRNEADRAPRTPSTNTLFVANLPFSVDDNALSAIFAGLNVKNAHVVRKQNDRSKGFGFVEFHNSDDQQKALVAVDKKNVDSRELIVKVALTEIPRENATTSSPAPAEVTK